MSLPWFAALLVPLLTLPVQQAATVPAAPAASVDAPSVVLDSAGVQAEAALPEEAPQATVVRIDLFPADLYRIDPIWFRPGCLQLRCGDEEWRRELQPLPVASRPSPRLPGLRRAQGLSAPARPRDSRSSYSNDARIGTRYGMQLVRDGGTQLSVEVGGGYRLAPAYDDGVATPGPIFRGGISLGHRFGEGVEWSQRLQFETGGGERFVKQMFGLDVALDDDWQFETDYVIRYDSVGASGTDTAEAWLGVRRYF